MKILLKPIAFLGGALVMANLASLSAQTISVTAGAVSTNAGSKLAFLNAAQLSIASGYVQPLVYGTFTNRIPATNAFYYTTNLIFQALSRTNSLTPAATGSHIVCEVESVTGPLGGVFSFWEQGAFGPTYSYPVYAITAGKRFDVSDMSLGAGLPGGDPFGSIPGRRFAVNKQGEYRVTFRLYDTSENNPTYEGPIHLASDALTIVFRAGIETRVTRIGVSNNVTSVSFRQNGVTNVTVQTSASLQSTWQNVAGPFTTAPTGTNVTTLNFTNSGAGNRFYRLNASTAGLP